ncbi:radical SAM protein, partial [Patescibacteria group bacterium]
MKEGYLYKKLENSKVQCQNCANYCIILPGKRGICGARGNQGGKLYTLNYNKAIACHIDPIEKKPFFHFLPGTNSLSIAAAGCNFRCLNCQNYDISQGPKQNQPILGENLPPKKVVRLAIKNKLPSISYTYTEPTIFSEYALDTMKLAKKKGIKSIWVTNGFLS